MIIVYVLDLERNLFEVHESQYTGTLDKRLRGRSADFVIIKGTNDEQLIQTAKLMVLSRNGKVFVVKKVSYAYKTTYNVLEGV